MHKQLQKIYSKPNIRTVIKSGILIWGEGSRGGEGVYGKYMQNFYMIIINCKWVCTR
jgi:hypothetical protein